ncbi:acyl-[ACP]--phospholipid O-acyltransferase [Thalassomonas sp. M1454]|uniref:acyl-[ACP]--phospholipid O-acyltransferase n=1 Tax=Thalassomonas sp. M1454 TaxID=2594477 RepID=UPI00117DCB5A|nr:acyl-[ACP]--phospholipid O-acyltransferase [Thalassomonas sp. M1454]TRX58117.1 MFS transporter [Thalassomonas sp. M1454]
MKQLFAFKGFFAYIAMVFINAFVDLGHKIIVQNTVFKIYDGDIQIVLTAVLNALILLPFILLFSPAGFIADKYPKPTVMRNSALVAIVATLLITLCYYQGWFIGAFCLTLLMGIQSALYSPAKYGYLKELIGVDNLAQGNALVQAVTIVSILSGTFVFSAFFELLLAGVDLTNSSIILQGVVALGWVMVALSVIEWWFSCQIKDTKGVDHGMTFSSKTYLQGQYLTKNLKMIVSNRTIWLSIVGLSMFWSVSQVMLATFPAFAKEVLSENNTLIIQGIMASTGIGIVLGSLFAARISKHHIELGLIPVSAISFALLLGNIASLNSSFSMALTFLGLGISGGLFIVPLNSLIQYTAKEDELGTVLAGNNWVQNVAMLSFLIITIALVSYGVSSVGIFYVLMAIALAGAIFTVYQLPHSLMRMITTFIIQHRYKLQILGFDNLPANGGLLLLGNHISWIDGLVVQMACPRKVRFVMLRSIYNRWYLKPIVKFFGAIPISEGNSKESLALVNQALKDGEVVCLFPEGAISRTGALGVFRTGFERVVDDVDGVIVPFYLHGLWGSRLSRANSSKLRENTQQGFRRDVSISFGKQLSMQTPASDLKQKVFELAFNAWEHQTSYADPLPLAWIKSAKHSLFKLAVKDTSGSRFSNLQLLAATATLAAKIKQLDNSQNIGLMLPASSAAVMANGAVLLNGQTAVNLNYSTSVDAVCSGIKNAEISTVLTSKKFIDKLNAKGIDCDTMLANTNIVFMEDLKQQLSKARYICAIIASFILPSNSFYKVFGKVVDINSPACILFSSGSEGTPKGIVLSHKNFLANVKQISDVLRTDDKEVVMGSLPPFHSFGLTVTTFLPLIEGIPVICHPDPTDALNIAKAIAKNKATLLCATATFLRLYTLNRKINPLMLENLRLVVAGAEKLPEDTRQSFKDKFNKTIYEGYGATETTPVASVNIPDQLDPNDLKVQSGSKVGTVGMPLPGCSFRIVDPLTMQTLPTGEQGLILISGSQLMLGYLNDEAKTKEVIVTLDNRRWYKTGDKGSLDSDGFLTIVDRYSRFAKIGGEMISLQAVEQEVNNVISDDMGEFMAVNLPDSKKGEKIVILTTTDITVDELRQTLLDNSTNPLMIPTAVYKVEQVPKLGSGKSDFAGAKKLALSFA